MQLDELTNDRFLRQLEDGSLRVASPDDQGNWHVHQDVKQRILTVFKTSGLTSFANGSVDKAALAPRHFNTADGVRLIPGGSAIRAGACVQTGVVVCPPAWINTGAYVDVDTMIDSHALVGSCAQVGKRVHLSAGAQLGGVLEPIGNRPVIIEDDVFIGTQAAVVEGVIIRRNAVIAPGVLLSASVTIYDTVNHTTHTGEVPQNAVVVPGSRPARGEYAQQNNLQLNCPVIVKYRDHNTDAATQLEQALR
ncbi:2,3,4,5-tetrahydropyridine-2,6-dicarboxylate N-succinyltransferase [Mucisphaera calidilacus]|uniref:2,3,4,5-tetrahydropyridine-2,6-dicarboxylate N-succinyltransferase n=1 Tax=Mucisphaera calidilacus TaxID=2527982 RepID=A0A518BXU8_9BACT|nr:2,3,4,5-tetrahydropyridine-2,6-dicarboxylate N-succinyltransferase [Mucisphaera calidilacus]QDU71805.1 2,3,4,5-tetrahydropyridine-2,6-dicarboxylate N-succinyltransferase [Mucisphaera calidilacus]